MKLSGNLVMSHWKTGLRMLSNNIYAWVSARKNIANLPRLRWWIFRRKLKFLFFKVSKDISIRASYGNLQMSIVPLNRCLQILLKMIRWHLCSYSDRITSTFGDTALASNKWLQERGTCIKRLFCPLLWSKKINIAFHKFLRISLLEQ